ncbi:hypothetical protein P3L10_025767 [Capsicum annuum]
MSMQSLWIQILIGPLMLCLVELNSIEKENLDNSRLQRIILGEPLLCKCLMMMWRIWTEILGMKLVIIFLWEENIYACDEICLRST